MDSSIQEQIRSYTETIDAMAPSVDALAPTGAADDSGRLPRAVVEIATPETAGRSKEPFPGWVVGVAAAALVLVVAVPVGLWLGTSDDDPVATIVTTTVPQAATTPPPTVPTTPPPTVPTTQLDAAGAVTKQETTRCGVEWAEDLGIIWYPNCKVTNVRDEDGGWTLFLYGRIPDNELEAFKAAKVTEFVTKCWVNYLFVVREGDEPVVVDSVRHFTPDGEMTETCRFEPDSEATTIP